uniref:Uncharacterized protein n=1 Tax=Strongyloides stercoralis TaxID=6248 RepID=A0A0K0E2X4_STRER
MFNFLITISYEIFLPFIRKYDKKMCIFKISNYLIKMNVCFLSYFLLSKNYFYICHKFFNILNEKEKYIFRWD